MVSPRSKPWGTQRWHSRLGCGESASHKAPPRQGVKSSSHKGDSASLKQLKAVLDTSLNATQPCRRGSTVRQTLSGLCDVHRRVHRPVPNRETVSLKSPSQLSQTGSVRRDVGNRRGVTVPLLPHSLKWCPENRFEAQAWGGWMGEPLSSCSVQRGRCSPRLLIWFLSWKLYSV